MTTKTKKKKATKNGNKNGAEKPVSLHGAPIEDILKALLNTKPMPKEANKKRVKNGRRKKG